MKKIISIIVLMTMIVMMFGCDQNIDNSSKMYNQNSKVIQNNNKSKSDIIIYKKDDGNIYFSNFSDIPETLLISGYDVDQLGYYIDVVNNYILYGDTEVLYAKSITNLDRLPLKFPNYLSAVEHYYGQDIWKFSPNPELHKFISGAENGKWKYLNGEENSVIRYIDYKNGTVETIGCDYNTIKNKLDDMNIKEFNIICAGENRYIITDEEDKQKLYFVDSKGNFNFIDEQVVESKTWYWDRNKDVHPERGENLQKVISKTGIDLLPVMRDKPVNHFGGDNHGYIKGGYGYLNGDCYYEKREKFTDEVTETGAPVFRKQYYYLNGKKSIPCDVQKLSAFDTGISGRRDLLSTIHRSDINLNRKCIYKSEELNNFIENAEVYASTKRFMYLNCHDKDKKGFYKYDLINKTMKKISDEEIYEYHYFNDENIIWVDRNKDLYLNEKKITNFSSNTIGEICCSFDNNLEKILYSVNGRLNLYTDNDNHFISPASYTYCISNSNNVIFNENNNIYIYKNDETKMILENTKLIPYRVFDENPLLK